MASAGQHCFSAGRLGDAERWYGLVAKGPKAFRTGRYLSDYATILRHRGKFKEAVALLRGFEKRPTAPILGARPSLARADGQWARQCLGDKDTAGAERMFRAARSYVPCAYLWEWVDVCQRRARFATAVRALEEAIAQSADHEGPWLGCDPRPEPGALTTRLAATYLTWADYEKRRRRYDRVADLYAKAKQADPSATPGLSAEIIQHAPTIPRPPQALTTLAAEVAKTSGRPHQRRPIRGLPHTLPQEQQSLQTSRSLQ